MDLVSFWKPRPLSDIQLFKTGVMLELRIHGVQEFSQERLLSRGSFRRETLNKESQAEKKISESLTRSSSIATPIRLIV